jgi:putative endonuclease
LTRTRRQRVGEQGEGRARRFLEDKGFVFRAANWRCPAGEIDLVMSDGDEIVFVEVKTRHGEGLGRAEEAVLDRQAARLLAAAAWYIDGEAGLDDVVWRIDLVAITLAADGTTVRLSHVENAIVVG